MQVGAEISGLLGAQCARGEARPSGPWLAVLRPQARLEVDDVVQVRGLVQELFEERGSVALQLFCSFVFELSGRPLHIRDSCLLQVCMGRHSEAINKTSISTVAPREYPGHRFCVTAVHVFSSKGTTGQTTPAKTVNQGPKSICSYPCSTTKPSRVQ